MKKCFMNFVWFSLVMTVLTISGFDRNEFQERELPLNSVTVANLDK